MEKIIDVNSSKQFQEDYTRYGVYVMYARVIPDYRDGLKPIHRRILWSAYHDSKAITNTVKSASIVGNVISEWSPHGDEATYGAIKPMVNWFECKVPLMDKQGNFGTFQGDGASAYRYTECKLSKFAYECILKDLIDSKECVDWTPNFKNTQLEPQYLPCAVPLLLINGTFAIGVGKKPEIPTHNLNEVIDAAINLMYNPNYEPILIPDHCMNCEIIDTDWRSISRLGFGYYTVRGIIDVENYTKHHYKNRTALVIKSVPNLTFLNSITDKIEEMINNKKIIQIEDMFDESEKDDMRYVIILKPGADVEYVKNMIYKNTLLEQTPRINFEAIDGLNPKRMSYKAYLLSFIDHRKLTKFRVYTNKLQDVQTKIHEKEAFIKVFESGYIDEIIKMLRNRKTVADDEALTEFLIKKIKITKLQAQYIINVRLKQLQEGNLKNLKEERSQLEKLKDEYLSIILSEEKLTNIIINELQQIKATYGKPRTCRVIKDNNSSDVPKGAMTVTITEKNFIKKVPYGSPISNPKSDSIRVCINVDNSENILIFDNMGKVFKLAVNKIPFADKNSGGTDIRFLIKGLTADICDIIPDTLFTSGNKRVKHYLLTLSKMGYIKKMDLEDFVNIPSSGLIYAKLEDGDYIRSIAVPIENMNILVFSEKKAMNIPVSNVSLMKRNARGNRTFKSSFVDGMTLLPPKDSLQYNKVSLMVITEFGRFNKLPIAGVPNLDTVKKQFNVIKATKGDRILDIHVVDEESTIVVKTLMDTHSIPVSAIPASSSISNGEKILNTTKDKIIRTYVK